MQKNFNRTLILGHCASKATYYLFSPMKEINTKWLKHDTKTKCLRETKTQ